MNPKSVDYSFIAFIVVGIYIIFRGVTTLTTGKLHPREEAGLHEFSENGIRRFKLLSAVTNILGGLLVIGIAVAKLLNLVDRNVLCIGTLAILAVMLVAYFLIRNSCKNLK